MVVSLLNKIRLLNKNNKMGRAELERFQRQKFEQLVAHALDRSPFYADYYLRHGIRKEHIKSLKITDLPFTNKKLLMDNFDRVVCDRKLKLADLQKYVARPENKLRKYPGNYTVIHSSGTSGKMGYFIYDKDEWEYPFALTSTRMDSPFHNLIKRANMIGVVATDGNYAGVSLLASAPKMLYNKLFIPINMPAAQRIDKINSFPGADIITGYAAGVYQLAKLQLSGEINERPRLITTSAELLTPQMRSVITEAFGVNPRNFYAASESLSMGCECELRTGLHLFTDFNIFELMDEKGYPVNEGETGRLVLTNLYRKTQPLIRYELNDTMSINPTPCSCGWPFPLVKSFEGRESIVLEFFKDARKGFIHHSQLKTLSVPGLQNSQFIQTGPESLLINAVMEGNLQEVVHNISQKMDGILQANSLEFVKYSITALDDIPVNSKTKKLETVIPLKPTLNN